jgi:hypothetical protein
LVLGVGSVSILGFSQIFDTTLGLVQIPGLALIAGLVLNSDLASILDLGPIFGLIHDLAPMPGQIQMFEEEPTPQDAFLQLSA